MRLKEPPSISFEEAQRAINNGAQLVKMDFSFCTAGGTPYTHWLYSTRGKTYRVSKRIAEALHVPPAQRDGGIKCEYPAGYMQQRGAS